MSTHLVQVLHGAVKHVHVLVLEEVCRLIDQVWKQLNFIQTSLVITNTFMYLYLRKSLQEWIQGQQNVGRPTAPPDQQTDIAATFSQLCGGPCDCHISPPRALPSNHGTRGMPNAA